MRVVSAATPIRAPKSLQSKNFIDRGGGVFSYSFAAPARCTGLQENFPEIWTFT